MVPYINVYHEGLQVSTIYGFIERSECLSMAVSFTAKSCHDNRKSRNQGIFPEYHFSITPCSYHLFSLLIVSPHLPSSTSGPRKTARLSLELAKRELYLYERALFSLASAALESYLRNLLNVFRTNATLSSLSSIHASLLHQTVLRQMLCLHLSYYRCHTLE